MSLILYFAGGGAKDVNDYLDSIKCDRLFSQLNDRKAIAAQIESFKLGNSGRIFIDSGAYSAHTKGVPIDVDDYINYLNEIEEYCEVYAQVDHIAGRFGQEKDPADVAKAPQISWDNYLYMRPKLKNPDKLMPVFHQGEDFKWLENMLEADFDGEKVAYIGVSCSKDIAYTEWPKWFDRVFDMIKRSSNPNVKTHAFGMTSLRYLPQYPFTSADSTSWIKFAAYGTAVTDFGPIGISERRVHELDHIHHLPEADKNDMIKYFKDNGFDYEQLTTDSNYRNKWNAHYYKTWCDNYKYIGPETFGVPSFF